MSVDSLVYLVIYLIVIGLVIWLLTYLIDIVPLPEPFGRVARIVIGVLIVILLLLQFVGVDGSLPRLAS